jgi:hypothetical protein
MKPYFIAATIVLTACVSAFVLADKPTDSEKEFKSLFNGKDLTGWRYGKKGDKENKAGKGYQVSEEGTLYCTRADGGNLYTEKEYADFTLRFEFKLVENANNGVGAKSGHLKPTGEWNSEEITAKGRRVTVKLNGHTIVDADLDEITNPDVLKKHPGLKREKGHIGFLGHGTRVEFRNIRIREL